MMKHGDSDGSHSGVDDGRKENGQLQCMKGEKRPGKKPHLWDQKGLQYE